MRGPYVTIAGNEAAITEGETANFTLTRTGDTSQALTAHIRVTDPDSVRRGNHWDTAPTDPTTVEFDAGESTASLSLSTSDDHREIPDARLTVEVAGGDDADGNGGYDYWLGYPYSASTSVTDDDTAPEISLSVDNTEIVEGGSFTVTVSRTGHAAAQTTRGTLVVSHDRAWNDPNNPEKSEELAFEIEGAVIEQTFQAPDNGDRESDWQYTVSIAPPESVPAESESEYWTVDGARSLNVGVRAVRCAVVSIRPGVESVVEGGEDKAVLVVSRTGDLAGNLRGVLVQTREWNGTIETVGSLKQHFVNFPAGESEVNLEVAAVVDDVFETNNFMVVRLLDRVVRPCYSFNPNARLRIRILSPSPTVTIAADSAGITEGETATYTLTRDRYTDQELTVNVTVSDPSRFMRGNHWQTAPPTPTTVTFAENSATATLELPTRDDRRDIPDDSITVTLTEGRAAPYTSGSYAIGSPGSAAVTVSDNDTKPEVRFSVNATEIEEGETAVLTLERTGDTANPLLFPMEIEPRGDTLQTYLMPGGRDTLRIRIESEEDDLDEADVHYRARLNHLTGESDYYTVVGPRTLNFTFVDDDLPMVGLRVLEHFYAEGEIGRVEIERVGQTDVPLDVKVRVGQTQNSLALHHLPLLGENTFRLEEGPTGTWSFDLASQDGDELYGLVFFRLLESEDYRIDPEKESDFFRVEDGDPRPVLQVSPVSASEGDTSLDFEITLTSPVSPPSRLQVTVDYTTRNGTAKAPDDFTEVSGTLVFPPGSESEVISVPLVDNGLAEDTIESFSLVFSNPRDLELPDGAQEWSVRGSITDDEPHVVVMAMEDEVTEGSPIRYRFQRIGSTEGDLTVVFRAGYENGAERWPQVTIRDGESWVIWEVPTEDDDLDEPDRRYLATVTDPAWWSQPTTYHSRVDWVPVTVLDNDLPVVTMQADHAATRNEGQTLRFTLTRVGVLDEALTVDLDATVEGSFLRSSPPTTITFAAGEATASLAMPTANDDDAENHGFVSVAIGDGTGYRVGEPGSAEVYITDDDRTYTASLSLVAQSPAVEEGENAVFLLTRTGRTDLNLVARVQVTEIGRGPDSAGIFGLRLVSTVTERAVTFNPGDETATLTVSTEDENANDGNSRIMASVLLDPAYGIDPYPSIANVWVRDNDIPTVSFAQAQGEHVEDPNDFPRYPLVRTGDTSYALGVKVSRHEVRHYGPPWGNQEHIFRSYIRHCI